MTEISLEVREAAKRWRLIWENSMTLETLSPLPAAKVFTPKYDIPILSSYNSPAPSWFWSIFPSNLVQPAISLIDAEKLKVLALNTRFADRLTLDKVYNDLKFGAKIGCKGSYRSPSKATNAPSAFDAGPQVTDAIADWINKGFAYGPVSLNEVPKNAKFSGIMTRPKPNGSVRIILNLSSPIGTCVNEGIDKDDFPTTMSSTSDWLRALHKAGRRARFCKIDWSDAYKHIAVHEEDVDLQWFQWGGMCFKELCLIFGSVSSAGIFDRTNKIVISAVTTLSRMDPEQVCQVLDDCCAAGSEFSSTIDDFDRIFYQVAADLGINLAPRDDPEKSFAPCQLGVVLGVSYDTVSWTWSLPQEKLCRLLHSIKAVMISDFFPQDGIWSIVGKILNVKPLVPGGRFNLDSIIKANSFSTERSALVPISTHIKKQLHFWFTMLQVCNGRGSLPDPDFSLPPWAIDVYTDSAGGSSITTGHGAGAVTSGWWAFVPWSKAINLGYTCSKGRSLARVMSALELVGPLLTVSSGYSWCKNTPVRIWVDNAGSVFIWKKGYSTSCELSTTLVKAIAHVASGLGCRVDLVKISRCSTPMASMADALSKGAFTRFWNLARSDEVHKMCLEPAWVPSALLQWISSPSYDLDLGHKILTQIAEKTKILGYNC